MSEFLNWLKGNINNCSVWLVFTGEFPRKHFLHLIFMIR